VDLVLGVRVGGQVFEEQLHPAVPDVHRRVRGVQPCDVGAQLADLRDQGLSLSHNTSISTLTPMSAPLAAAPTRRQRNVGPVLP
jgi:hypothetical protein